MPMTPEQMEERTRDSMLKGFHCSQAVMAAGLEKCGFADENLLRAMAPMGGGVAASGGPCGALTGGIAMLGRLYGKPTPEARDDKRMWTATAEFYRRFETEIAAPHGSVNCRDIAKVDWKNKEQVKEFYAGAGAKGCACSTGKAARILGEVIEKYAEGGG